MAVTIRRSGEGKLAHVIQQGAADAHTGQVTFPRLCGTTRPPGDPRSPHYQPLAQFYLNLPGCLFFETSASSWLVNSELGAVGRGGLRNTPRCECMAWGGVGVAGWGWAPKSGGGKASSLDLVSERRGFQSRFCHRQPCDRERVVWTH